MLFARALALTDERRVTSVAVHPGCIDTDTFTAAYGIGGLPVVDGAAHVLHAADPVVEVVNGGYYEGLLPAEPAPPARDAGGGTASLARRPSDSLSGRPDGAGCRCTRCARAPNARADVALKDAVCDDFDLLVVGPQRTGGGAAASSAVAPTAPRAR